MSHFRKLLDDRSLQRIQIPRVQRVIESMPKATLKKKVGDLVDQFLGTQPVKERRPGPFGVLDGRDAPPSPRPLDGFARTQFKGFL